MNTAELLDNYIKNIPFIISSGNISLRGVFISLIFAMIFPKVYEYFCNVLDRYISNKNIYGKKKYIIKHYIQGYRSSLGLNTMFSNLSEYFELFENNDKLKFIKSVDYRITEIHNSFSEAKPKNIIIFDELYALKFKGHTLYFESKNIRSKESSHLIIYSDTIRVIHDFMVHINEKLSDYYDNINYNQNNGIKIFEAKYKKIGDDKRLAWKEVKYPNTKTFDNIFLTKENEEQLQYKLNGFLDEKNEAKYKKFGMPRKLGILLYGPPGTGKTSTAYAIAHKMKCNVHILSQDSFKNIDTLQTLLNSATPTRALFLIEEVDTYKWANKDSNDEDESSSLVSISSASSEGNKAPLTVLGLDKDIKKDYIHSMLDKSHAKEYSIIVMTTNSKKEELSPAIIRAGRCDITHLYDDKMTEYQVKNMIKRYTGFELEDEEIISGLIENYKIVDLNDKLFYDILNKNIKCEEDLKDLLKYHY